MTNQHKRATQTKKQRQHFRCPRWERVLCGLFATLFLWVLPFICLGAFGEPGHPHRFPHFVFADPVLMTNLMVDMQPDEISAASQISVASQSGAASQMDHGKMKMPSHAVQQQPLQPVGRSSSSLILFSILMIASLGAWVLSRIDRRQVVSIFPHPFPESVPLAILLPPPRVCVLPC